ncbi:type 1 fimbrial protein [Serratia fonticola]|jgi:type 1 fimbria pilin|nr:type 1 fimbrial protein [Serratia fonticola]MBL5826475.1 type 1 fimbrial protein [Serratia fonticola]MBL5861737.1 type 1 fimbrial protein [Serratia fonticola]MDK2377316.1 type 1 fimbrial protein [Serratia fonticola]
MMNKQTLGMMGVAILVSATATAAPVANLKINGDIKPPTCTVNGGDQADLIYNLGAVSPSVIPQSTTYQSLPIVINKLTVECDAATYLSFKATDAYPNEFILPPGMNRNFKANAFTMVDSSDTSKTIGGVSYRWDRVTVDGETAYISRANDAPDDNKDYAYSMYMLKNATNAWTKIQQKYVDVSALELISGKVFTADISTNRELKHGNTLTYILPRDELDKQGVDISEGIDYTSNTILTFNFGV